LVLRPPGLARPVLRETEAIVPVKQVEVQIVPAFTIQSVLIAAYRHYNAIASYNQTIKFL
jgi:hypothetical protein